MVNDKKRIKIKLNSSEIDIINQNNEVRYGKTGSMERSDED
jgi:hypothetical protein